MPQIETGTVVDWKESGYGFIRPDDDDRDGDLFFHAREKRTVVPGRRGPEFSRTERVIGDPIEGDRVVFIRSPGDHGKGPKASPWAFEEEWTILASATNDSVR